MSRWLTQLRLIFRSVFRRERVDQELNEELQYHLEREIAEGRNTGLAPEQARLAALRAMGSITKSKEECRDMRRLNFVDNFLRDFRYGLRTLWKDTAFTFAAIAVLTIGVSASVIVFSIANALILRPLPVSDPGQVVRAYTGDYSNTFYSDYIDYRDRNQTLSGLAAFQSVPLVLRIDGAPEYVSGTAVSGNYFAMLGVSAAFGRVISPEDDRLGNPGVVVLSNGYWQRRFGADAGIVGQSVMLNGHPFTVVGIAPPAFVGTQSPVAVDAWVAWNAPSLNPTEQRATAGEGRLAHLIGRLRPGVTLSQAQADIARVAAQPAAGGTDASRTRSLTLFPARALLPQLSSQVNALMILLVAVAVLVLLIATVNTASLILARSEGRRREIAVRFALGAGRPRLIGQLLTESILLSSLASIAAVAVTIFVGRLVGRLSLPVAEPLVLDLTFDWRVMAFTVGLSILTAVLFGLAPAVQASGVRVLPALRGGVTGGQRPRIRGTLVVAQVALSTVLLVGAGVLVRSMVQARSIDIGFSTNRVVTASIDLSPLSYTDERGIQLFDRLRDRLSRDPAIASVSVIGIVPLTVSSQASAFVKEGSPAPAPKERLPQVFFDSVSAGYFQTVQIPLLAGRDFTSGEPASAPQVAIINETLANRFWPGENPIGKHLQSVGPRNSLGPSIEVVGLARNARYATVGENPKAFLYFPLSQMYTPRVTLLVRAPLDNAAAVLPAVRSAVRDLAPDVPILRVGTLEQATDVSLLPLRVATVLAAALGIVALALAAVAIYGMTAFVIRQRRREIGVRLALGAESSWIVRALTRESLRWTTTGLALGLATSLVATQLLRSFLYDISPIDPVAFAAIPALLALTAYVACRVPASAAARVDPLRALRDE